jgi:hypothetical protein
MTRPIEEDENYLVSTSVDEFAVADEDALDSVDEDLDDDELEQSVSALAINDVKTYLKEAIAEQDSIDQIDLTEGAKMTPTQQIAVHKLVKQHLINVQTIIINKVKE